MRLVVQRVSRASVSIGGRITGAIDRGLLVLCGVGRNDAPGDAPWLVGKVLRLRIFPDADGRMNLPVTDVPGAGILVVSQFTLYGDCRKGNRPGYTDAAPPAEGEAGYERFVDLLRAEGLPVATGEFGGDMQVDLVNDGPVTLLLESEGRT